VDGITLDVLIEARRAKGEPFSEDELRGLLEHVLAALDHLHDRGIYHRDIKPANILITHEGVPVLIDFGSARQRLGERSMTVVESAGYTPFEQLQSRGNVGPWSDLYALGGTIEKAITGEAPPKAMDRMRRDPRIPLAQRADMVARYSASLLASIDLALAVEETERWQNAGEWLEALRGEVTVAIYSSVSPATERQPISSLIPGKKVNPLPWIIAAAAALGIASLIGMVFSNKKQDTRVLTVADDATVNRGREKADIAAAHAREPDARNNSAEQEKQALEAKAREEVASAITGGVVLAIDYPPVLIEGTPKAMRVPNLVQVPDKAPTFIVPKEAVLLSKGKKVTSSDDNPIIGSLDLITDGDKEAGEGYFVELLEGPQWVQIDLDSSATLNAICVWHYHSQKRAYKGVVIQVSDDSAFMTGVTTIYNNDYDNVCKFGSGPDNPYVESRFGLIADGKSAKGRYVRLYSNGNTSNEMNHYIEVEVYGIHVTNTSSVDSRKSDSIGHRDIRATAPPPSTSDLDPGVKSVSSYALGYRTGGNFYEQFGKFGLGAGDLDTPSFLKGFVGAVQGEKPGIAEDKLQAAMQVLGDLLQTREKNSAGASSLAPGIKSDSSYALGYRTGGSFDQQFSRFGVTVADLDTESFLKGFLTAVKGEKPSIGEENLLAAMQAFGDHLQAREKEVAAANLEKGRRFIEENGKRPRVVTTASGLQYEVLTKGSEEKYNAPKEGATDNKEFLVNYKGTLIDNTEFDASPAGKPVPMTLQVVPGLKEALTTMPVGAKWKLFIPSAIGYGEERKSSQLAPNSVLIFELQLVKIQDAKKDDKK